MKKESPDIVSLYHKNPKVKVSDVLTGFCCAPKFCDGQTDRQTDRHCQFLKLRMHIFLDIRKVSNDLTMPAGNIYFEKNQVLKQLSTTVNFIKITNKIQKIYI